MKTDAETAFRLLVIDDESQNLGLIELALEQQGLEILTTTDSEARSRRFSGEASGDRSPGFGDAEGKRDGSSGTNDSLRSGSRSNSDDRALLSRIGGRSDSPRERQTT